MVSLFLVTGSVLVLSVATTGYELTARQDVQDDSIYKIDDGVTAPVVVKQEEFPQFPEAARTAGITEATVKLEGVVRKDGTASMIQVIESPGYGFEESARKSLEQWRFRPGTKDGQPINVRLTFVFNFHLRSSAAK